MLPVSRKPDWLTVGHLSKETTPSSGLSQDKPRQYGVGFSANKFTDCHHRNPLWRVIENSCPSHENIGGLCEHHIRPRPTLTSTPEAKDQFYGALQETLSRIPSSEGIYLLGDFNAHVGTDWQACPTCLGHFGIGRMNENRQRFLELCCQHGLCITCYFKCKDLHKVSWRHPWSRHEHQLDLVITRRAVLSSVLHTRSYHSADCDTDHSLIASKVRLKPRKIHHAKTKGRPHINTCGTSDPVKAQIFADSLQEKLAAQPTTSNPDAKWSHLLDAIYDSAMAAFSKKEHNNTDWFEACWEEMQPVTEAKTKAMLARKQNPFPSTRDVLRAAGSKAQQTAHRCANEY